MRLDVVIPAYNSGSYLVRCLESLATSSKGLGDVRVVVVDNGSTDGSVDALGTPTSRLQVVRNLSNRGFAVACNQGAALGDSPFILFLNSDTVVNEDALRASLEFMESPAHAHIGICGVQIRDEHGTVTASCSRFPTPMVMWGRITGLNRPLPHVFPPQLMVDWDHRSSRVVDQLIGAFYFVRRDLFHSLGGFDERFFLYFEEVDFALRAARAGAKSYYLAAAGVSHVGGGSSRKLGAARHFYLARSRTLYAFKHFRRSHALALAIGALAIEPISRSLFFAASGHLRSALDTLGGTTMLWREAPALLRGRAATTQAVNP
jgi:N-acetylglucosaminyl-diphospho-decaprenol L-rhamnosyltransferase